MIFSTNKHLYIILQNRIKKGLKTLKPSVKKAYWELVMVSKLVIVNWSLSLRRSKSRNEQDLVFIDVKKEKFVEKVALDSRFSYKWISYKR